MIRYIIILTILVFCSCCKDPYAKGNLTEYDSNGNLVSQGDTSQWKTTSDTTIANKLFKGRFNTLPLWFRAAGWRRKQCDNANFKFVLYPNPVYHNSGFSVRIYPPKGMKIWFFKLALKTDPTSLTDDIVPTLSADSTYYYVNDKGKDANFFQWGSDDLRYIIFTPDTCSYVGHGYVKIM